MSVGKSERVARAADSLRPRLSACDLCPHRCGVDRTACRAALAEMHRQVGDLIINEGGLATRGLLVRHLVLPSGLAGTDEVLSFLAAHDRGVSPRVDPGAGPLVPLGRVGGVRSSRCCPGQRGRPGVPSCDA